MVIMSPAVPSETVKLDPIEVSRPIGRISAVTTEKTPSVTETTAGQECRVGGAGGAAGRAGRVRRRGAGAGSAGRRAVPVRPPGGRE